MKSVHGTSEAAALRYMYIHGMPHATSGAKPMPKSSTAAVLAVEHT
jgi:hypothetical protein